MVNIYVHPEFWKIDYPVKAVHQSYLDDMMPSLDENSILIKQIGDNSILGQKILKEKQLESASWSASGELRENLGYVDKQEWDKFIALIGKDNEYKIHGCSLGHCTEGFAIQLYAHLFLGQHWHDWIFDRYNEKTRQGEEDKTKELEKKGAFLNSPIKYGTVITLKGDAEIISPNAELPFGNITYQLIDDKTKIFGDKVLRPK